MAMSVTQTYSPGAVQRGIKTLTCVWVSAADGSASAVLDPKIVGEIRNVKFIPSATAAPTASYDVTLLDAHGIDYLKGLGADQSATVAAMVHPRELDAVGSGPLLCHVPLTLTIAAAGDTKGGTVIITWR